MLSKITSTDPRLSTADASAQKLRLLTEQADKVAIYNAKARGELVLASEVERALVAALAELRAGLLTIPNEMGPEIATIDDKNECVALIKERIYAAMNSIAESNIGHIVEQALQGSKPTDEEDVEPA